MIEYLPILVLVISFVILLLISVPVAWSIAISSLLTIVVSVPLIPSLTTVSQRIATGLDSFALLAIPFFIYSLISTFIFAGIIEGIIKLNLINFKKLENN